MNDFQKTLATLQATDLTFLVPQPTPIQSRQNKRRSKTAVGKKQVDTAIADTVSANVPSPAATDNTAAEAIARSAEARHTDSAPRERPFGEHKLPAFLPLDKPVPERADADATPAPDFAADVPRKRRHIEHEWPPVGAILAGTYFGTTYRAEVVTSNKRLKSGKQLKLFDGPAKGRRLDSFTKALLVATARQRREGKLKRKNATNGWGFWVETAAETAG